jgi:hypothetical protein
LHYRRSGKAAIGNAKKIALGAAVGGAIVMPLGDVAGQSHVPARHFQELPALAGVTQPRGRLQAAIGHPLVFFTRRHGPAP